VTSLQNKIEESRQKLGQINSLTAQIQALEAENEAHMKEKGALETERDDIKKYASELVVKVKNEVENKEFMIDRRMINTFLV